MEKMNLVLLPGLLCDASLFRAQADALADVVQGVMIADLTLEDSISSLAKETLAQMPDGPCVVVGMSMGGYVAFEMIRQAPERIRALCLLSTSADPETPEATAGRDQLMTLAEEDFPAAVETLLKRMAQPDKADQREVGGVFQSMATGLGVEILERQQQAIIDRADSRPTLALIDCPTLVVSGRQDKVMPLAGQFRMAAAIVGVQMKVIDDCGHLAPLEQAKQVTEILREWLSGLPKTPTSGKSAISHRPPGADALQRQGSTPKKEKTMIAKILAVAVIAAGFGSVSIPASAQTIVRGSPPEPRQEATPAQRRGQTWIAGHWQWKNARHQWVPGKWIANRRGQQYQEPMWVRCDDCWILQAGRWAPRGNDRDGDGVRNRDDQYPNNPNRN